MLAVTFTKESPIDAAIQGAVDGTRDWIRANDALHPAGAVLLVTNGVATPADSVNCKPTLDNARLAASNGILNTPPVQTYVLAVGGPNADLDAIALAGGTAAAYPVTSGADVLANLISIRQAFVPCDVTVSVTEQDIVSGKLNVELHVEGKPAVRYGRVMSASDCSPNSTRGEWYVDESPNESRVRLCPRTCDSVRAVSDATLDIVHGCQTTLIH
jgi:hypothetical protein